MDTAVIIVGHGSRSKEANATFLSIINKLDDKNTYGVFMEFGSPSIEDIFDKLYSEGIRNFKVVPLFLYGGIHITEDIPHKIELIKQKMPQISVAFGKPLGDDDHIVQLLRKRISETILQLGGK